MSTTASAKDIFDDVAPEIAMSQKDEGTKKEEPEASINSDDAFEKKLETTSKKVNEAFEPGKSISIDDIINASEKLGPEAEEKKAPAVTDLSKTAENNEEEEDIYSFDKPSFSPTGFRVELENNDGAGYIGTIYLGSEEQPARVLFDTGSDYLAVTSDLCDDPSLGKQEEDEAIFNSTTLTFTPSGKDLRKCKSTAFATKQSTSDKMLNNTKNLDYGSAKLSGKVVNDKACLD